MNKLSAVYGTICPLLIAAGCSSGGGGPELPDPDGDFEGIEEATQGLTDLSAQCTFVAGTGRTRALTEVMTPKAPSEPSTSSRRSGPAALAGALPRVSVPIGVATVSPTTSASKRP